MPTAPDEVASPTTVRPRRVLFATHHDDLVEPIPRLLLDLVLGLHEDPTVECLVSAPSDGVLVDQLTDAGVPTVVTPTPQWIIADLHSPLPVPRSRRTVLSAGTRAMPAWLQLIRRVRPDTVVTVTSLIPTPALAARACGVDHLWWVTELMRQHPDHRYALGVRQTARLMNDLSRQIVVTSTAVADSLVGVPRTRVRVVPPASTVPTLDDRPTPPRPDRPLRLLLLDQFEPGRGAETAILATDRARRAGADVELRLAGPAHAHYRARLARQADQCRSRHHIGWLDADVDPVACLDEFDVVVMPASVDAHGAVSRGALRRGRPVVGVASGATIELIEDGQTGLLFPPDDIEALTTILVALAADRDEVARLSRAAWAAGRRSLHIAEAARLFRAVLDERPYLPPAPVSPPVGVGG